MHEKGIDEKAVCDFFMISLQSHALYKTVVTTLGSGLERLQLIPSLEKMAQDYQIDPRGHAAELLYQQVCTLQHGESAKTRLVCYCLQDTLEQKKHNHADHYLQMLHSKHATTYLQSSKTFRESC